MPTWRRAVDLARVVQARRLAPLDTVDDPSGAEWALGAVLHDLLQVTNPSWIRRSAPKRLLDLASAHARANSPSELRARSARAPHVVRAPLRLASARHGGLVVGRLEQVSREGAAVEPLLVARAAARQRRRDGARAHGAPRARRPGRARARVRGNAGASLLRATPLTDFATCVREAPRSRGRRRRLALVRAPIARTLALRAVALAPMDRARRRARTSDARALRGQGLEGGFDRPRFPRSPCDGRCPGADLLAVSRTAPTTPRSPALPARWSRGAGSTSLRSGSPTQSDAAS